MRTNIIKIGNSQGIRIPKILLEQSRLGKEVEIEVEDEKIVIRPIAHPREKWEEKFRLMYERGDDNMTGEDITGQSLWDQTEWEW